MRPILLLTAIAASVPVISAQAPAEMMKIPIFYTVPGMDAVRVERDVVFRTAGETQLRADVYLPAKPGTYPVVLLVSGGAVHDWRTSGFYTSLGRVLAAEGIAAVSYDKRFSRDMAGVVTASEDTLALADYLRANAGRFGLDTTRLCTWHFSAGGRLAGVTLGEKSPAACVIATYAILSFGQDEDDNPKVAPYSALVQVRQRGGKIPPTLVVRAGRDTQALNEALDAFVAAGLARNAPITVINYPAGSHGFEIVDDTAETRRTIARSIAWLESQLDVR